MKETKVENELKEINRRVMVNDESGMACGPCDVLAADAEMVVNDDGKAIYLHVQWVSEAPGFLHEATTESIYDIYEQMNCEGDIDASAELLERISSVGIGQLFPSCGIEVRYGEQFQELERLIKVQLEARGYEAEDFFDEDGEEAQK